MVAVSLSTLSSVVLAFAGVAFAIPNPTVDHALDKRAASCTFPTPPKTSILSAPKIIAKGATFDGGNVRYHRGSGACETGEGGEAEAVFLLEEGATIQNVVIGASQMEGIHCRGQCNILNVWFEDVCEDAITIKQSSGTSNIRGGGAKNASDKVVQHNGCGTVNIDSYCVQNFGKLYRSCGNCSTQCQRRVNLSNIIAINGSCLAGINSNYGDIATLATSSISVSSVSSRCDTYKGNSSGTEPIILTSNVSNSYCQF